MVYRFDVSICVEEKEKGKEREKEKNKRKKYDQREISVDPPVGNVII